MKAQDKLAEIAARRRRGCMVSYAQNYEDVLLERVFKGAPPGFYIDIGAFHPLIGSTTRHFYDQGWSGINVEPVAAQWRLFEDDRRRDLNLNVAVSDAAGGASLFTIAGTGRSTFEPLVADIYRGWGEEVRAVPAPTMTLADICARAASPVIDFLKIDVEGWERQVLAGGDWRRFRPRVVLAEAVAPQTGEPTWEGWEGPLLAQGYHFVWFDGLNRFYVRDEDREMARHFDRPPNFFDDFIRWETVLLADALADLLDGGRI